MFVFFLSVLIAHIAQYNSFLSSLFKLAAEANTMEALFKPTLICLRMNGSFVATPGVLSYHYL